MVASMKCQRISCIKEYFCDWCRPVSRVVADSATFRVSELVNHGGTAKGDLTLPATLASVHSSSVTLACTLLELDACSALEGSSGCFAHHSYQ
jgi:hypothetical protein